MPAPGKGTTPRCRTPGAIPPKPGSLRRGTAAPPSPSRCGDPARPEPPSCVALPGRVQGAEQQLPIFHPGLVTVQGTGRRSRNDLAFDGKHRRVAGTHEIVLGGIPMVGASEVSAARAEGQDTLGGFDDPGRSP